MMHSASTLRGEKPFTTQVAIIGSGAGGSMLARALMQKGVEVLLLEQGAHVPSSRFNQREATMYDLLYEGGARTGPSDFSSAILYGRVLGGSTVHYMANSFRLPGFKMTQWREKHGLDWVNEDTLNPLYEQVEDYLGVHDATEAELNENNRLIRKGIEKLGWHGQPARHARRNCIGAGTCLIGCPYDKKQSQLVTSIPELDAAGVPILTDTQVTRLFISGAPPRVSGLLATVRDPATGKAVGSVRVQAQVVVLSMGGVGSAVFVQKNRLLRHSAQAGKNFQVTPHLFVLGEFDHKVNGAYGLPCGWVCHQFEEAKGGEGGYMIQGVFAQPGMVASMMPGFGRDHRALMRLFSYGAGVLSLMDDEEPGEVRVSPGGKAKIMYTLRGKDLPKARDFLKKASQILLAAGAGRVIVPDTTATTLTSEKDLPRIDALSLRPGSLPWVGTSCLGTLRMGKNPDRSVVGLNGETHEIKNLFVSDASWFPASSAVDPSLTIMANALRVSEIIHQRLD